MSAYMCSQRQLSILAAYAVRHCAGAIPYRLRPDIDVSSFREASEARRGGYNRALAATFRMLVSENLASLDARYPADRAEHSAIEEVYAYDARAARETLPPLHIIKLCHHYAYQSCEHDGWKASDSRKLIDAIESHAVHSLPGYDTAPWGVE